MSDDGYYADSPYDDLEDILYDADPGPNLAEDLAEHTLHSPVYQEDASYDFLDYYSDWEYYSDDYYDDDPALLKHNTLTGSPPGRKHDAKTAQGKQKRGKKRKLADTAPSIEKEILRPTLNESLRGTVWKKRASASPGLYEPGASESVALLKDWQNVFAAEDKDGGKSYKTFGRGQLQSDESWANDMSLADMGLQTATGFTHEASTGHQDSALVEDEAGIEDDEGLGEFAEQDVEGSATSRIQNTEGVAAVDGSLDVPAVSPLARKRLKLTGLPSPPAQRGLETEGESSGQQQDLLQSSQHPSTGVMNGASTRTTRKRKASDHVEKDDAGQTFARPTKSSRAKKVATTQPEKDDTGVTIDSGRPTRKAREPRR